jgi:ubiquinone/menaquinone biosynthesis C-methylase UbiE
MTTSAEHPRSTGPEPAAARCRLTATEIRALDPYQLMAELGKTVIHPGGRRSTEELLAMASIRSGQRVLDAGCGIGTTAGQIARRWDCEVVALDINEANLDRARRTVEQIGVTDRVTVSRGDIEQLASTTRASTWSSSRR